MCTEKICGTCRHKGEPVIYHDGGCISDPLVVSPYFQCQRFKLDHRPQPGQGAVIQDGSDYTGRMCVEEDFGCIKWEAPDGAEETV